MAEGRVRGKCHAVGRMSVKRPHGACPSPQPSPHKGERERKDCHARPHRRRPHRSGLRFPRTRPRRGLDRCTRRLADPMVRLLRRRQRHPLPLLAQALRCKRSATTSTSTAPPSTATGVCASSSSNMGPTSITRCPTPAKRRCTPPCARPTALPTTRRLRVLLAHGADPNGATKPGVETGAFMRDCRTRGETPLHRAAAFGTEETIQLLLDAGAKVDAHDANGESPLSWASWHLRPRLYPQEALLRRLCHSPRRRDTFAARPRHAVRRRHGNHPAWQAAPGARTGVSMASVEA